MSQVTSFVRGMFTENIVFKAVALILTLSLFIWVRDDREASVVAFAPVRIVIPDGMELLSPPIDRVRLTVRGRWSDINTFDPTSVEPILIEAAEEAEQLIPITNEMVQLPPGLQPTTIQPDVVRIKLEKTATKSIPIKAKIVGTPRESFRLGDAKITPPTITFKGPASAIEPLEFVMTEAIDVSGLTVPVERRVQLRPESPLVSFDLSTVVTVSIPIETVEVRRTVQNIEVIVLNAVGPTAVKPDRISATVRGPKAAVDAIDSTALHATVEISEADSKSAMTLEKQPVIKNLPPDVTLVEYYPRDVIVTTTRPNGPR